MIRKISLAAAAALFTMPAFACDGFQAQNAYARASTRMSQSGAVFMTMQNTGDAACRVTGARAAVADRLELHTHIMTDEGVMQMREVEGGFPIEAHGTRELARGGDHVMIMGLHEALEQDQVFALTLEFEDGSETTFDVVVDNERMPTQGMSQMQGHGQMQGHDQMQDHDQMQGHDANN